ncbi:MAG: hypothetical protein CMH98_01550 [Oceanospirillaceae bacterium]|nr:hypothetical protein [Oceanospirillaceae bacterium]
MIVEDDTLDADDEGGPAVEEPVVTLAERNSYNEMSELLYAELVGSLKGPASKYVASLRRTLNVDGCLLMKRLREEYGIVTDGQCLEAQRKLLSTPYQVLARPYGVRSIKNHERELRSVMDMFLGGEVSRLHVPDLMFIDHLIQEIRDNPAASEFRPLVPRLVTLRHDGIDPIYRVLLEYESVTQIAPPPGRKAVKQPTTTGTGYVTQADLERALKTHGRDAQSKGRQSKDTNSTKQQDRRGHKPKHTKDVNKIDCFNCGSKGHYASQCKAAAAVCDTCSKKGHLTEFCQGATRWEQREASRGRANVAVVAEVHTTILPSAFVVRVVTEHVDVRAEKDTASELDVIATTEHVDVRAEKDTASELDVIATTEQVAVRAEDTASELVSIPPTEDTVNLPPELSLMDRGARSRYWREMCMPVGVDIPVGVDDNALPSVTMLVDSGATHHLTNDPEILHNVCIQAPIPTIKVANGTSVKVQGVGTMVLEVIDNEGAPTSVVLTDVLLVPELDVGLGLVGLLSVGQMLNEGAQLDLSITGGTVLLPNDISIPIQRRKELLTLTGTPRLPEIDLHATVCTAATDSADWEAAAVVKLHMKMGHASLGKLRQLCRDHPELGVTIPPSLKQIACDACRSWKGTQHSVNREADCDVDNPGQLLFTDIWGPASQQSLGGSRYCLSLRDYHTGVIKVTCMPRKTACEVQRALDKLVNEFNTSCKWHVPIGSHARVDASTSVIQCDNSPSYLEASVQEWAAQKGILLRTSEPNAPARHGFAEVRWRDLFRMVNCLLDTAKLGREWWAEAAHHAAMLLNCSPCRTLGGQSPFEKLTGRQPNLSTLRVWGSSVHVRQFGKPKSEPKSFRGRYVGHSIHNEGYRVFNPATGAFSFSRDVVFMEIPALGVTSTPEHVILYDPPKGNTQSQGVEGDSGESETAGVGSKGMTESESDRVTVNTLTLSDCSPAELANDDPNDPDPVYEIDRVVNIRGPPGNRVLRLRWKGFGPGDDSDRKERELRKEIVPSIVDAMISHYYDRQKEGHCDTVTDGFDSDNDVAEVFAARGDMLGKGTPRSLREALSSPERGKWLPASQRELNNLTSTGTIRILLLNEYVKKPLKTRFVYRQKIDPKTATIVEWKARLVVKGFMEDATGLKCYSPVTSAETVRSLISVTAMKDYPVLRVIDFSAAFLQAPLKRNVTIELPFSVDGRPVQASLSKALYGLSDAPSLWNDYLHDALTEVGLVRSQWDTCLYVKSQHGDGDIQLMVALWVDDLLVSGCEEAYQELVKHLHTRHFKFKELGDARVFLGLEIDRNRKNKTIEVCQRGYIKQLLVDFGMDNCKPRSIPISPGTVLSRDQCPRTDEEKSEMAPNPYGVLIGKLIHLAKWSRGDLCVSVSTLAKYTLNPGMPHWLALKGVLRYLKGTLDLSLRYGGHDGMDELVVYSDANLGSSEETRKSTSGFVNMYGGAGVTWGSTIQTLTALSTLQAEGVAASLAVQRGIHTRRVLTDMGIQHSGPTKVYVDNQGLQTMVANRNENGPRAKYYDLKYFYLIDQVDVGAVRLLYIRTDKNVADQFTKALPKVTLARFRDQLHGHLPIDYG